MATDNKTSPLKNIGNWIKKNVKILGIITGVSALIGIFTAPLFNKPKFHFFTEDIAAGDITINRFNHVYLMVAGGISNDGGKPLFPVAFQLKVKFENWADEIIYTSYALTDSLKNDFKPGNFKGVQVKFDTEKELLKIPKISPGDAAYGIILFVSLKNTFLRVPPNSEYEWIEMSCIDVKGKVRSHMLDLKNLKLAPPGLSFPKSGTEQL